MFDYKINTIELTENYVEVSIMDDYVKNQEVKEHLMK